MNPGHLNKLILAVVVIAIVLILTLFIPLAIGFEKSSQFGDMFGAANALFAGLGFAAIVWTLILQMEAGNEQRRQQQFETALRLIDDVKSDLASLTVSAFEDDGASWHAVNREYHGMEGFVKLLTLIISKNWKYETSAPVTKVAISSLVCSVDQLNRVWDYANRQLRQGPELEIVKDSIGVLVVRYFLRLKGCMDHIEFSDGELWLLKQSAIDLVGKQFPNLEAELREAHGFAKSGETKK